MSVCFFKNILPVTNLEDGFKKIAELPHDFSGVAFYREIYVDFPSAPESAPPPPPAYTVDPQTEHLERSYTS